MCICIYTLLLPETLFSLVFKLSKIQLELYVYIIRDKIKKFFVTLLNSLNLKKNIVPMRICKINCHIACRTCFIFHFKPFSIALFELHFALYSSSQMLMNGVLSVHTSEPQSKFLVTFTL